MKNRSHICMSLHLSALFGTLADKSVMYASIKRDLLECL